MWLTTVPAMQARPRVWEPKIVWLTLTTLHRKGLNPGGGGVLRERHQGGGRHRPERPFHVGQQQRELRQASPAIYCRSPTNICFVCFPLFQFYAIIFKTKSYRARVISKSKNNVSESSNVWPRTGKLRALHKLLRGWQCKLGPPRRTSCAP